MNQPTQEQPVQTPPVQSGGQGQSTPPTKKSNIWLWIIGGCLTIVIVGMLIFGGLVWWGARMADKALDEAKPGLDQWQKNAEDLGKQAEEWGKQMEEAQKNMPNPEDFDTEGFQAE